MDEVKGSEEANGSGSEHDRNCHKQRVANVEHGRYRSAQTLQIKDQIVDRVSKDVQCN